MESIWAIAAKQHKDRLEANERYVIERFGASFPGLPYTKVPLHTIRELFEDQFYYRGNKVHDWCLLEFTYQTIPLFAQLEGSPRMGWLDKRIWAIWLPRHVSWLKNDWNAASLYEGEGLAALYQLLARYRFSQVAPLRKQSTSKTQTDPQSITAFITTFIRATNTRLLGKRKPTFLGKRTIRH